MPRDDATAVLRISARGLHPMQKMLDIDQKYIRALVQETIEEVGLVAQDILADHAPDRTGRLKGSVVVTGRNRSTSRPQIRIGVVGARSETGFPYLNVTRFGRRAVEASRTREGFRPLAGTGSARLARTPATGSGQHRPFRAHMLRYTPGQEGTPSLYRRRAKAYHPGRDWVRASDDDIKTMSDYAFRKVTRDIEKALTSGGSKPRTTSVSVRSRFGRFS
jgi:hypothetical protein